MLHSTESEFLSGIPLKASSYQALYFIPPKASSCQVACVFWLSGGWSTSATVKINEDGTVSLLTDAVDMGTGYLCTSVVQMAAEELDIRPEDVHLGQGDTDHATYDHGTRGSRGVYTVARVARMAAQRVKEEIFQEAAKGLGVEQALLETRGGWVYQKERVMIGEQGEVINPNLQDYKMPTSLDVPETESVIVEVPAATGPHGAKGLGEPTMAPPAAAIANAICDAAGIRMHAAPMTLEDVFSEI